jgi:hypothetical protein
VIASPVSRVTSDVGGGVAGPDVAVPPPKAGVAELDGDSLGAGARFVGPGVGGATEPIEGEAGSDATGLALGVGGVAVNAGVGVAGVTVGVGVGRGVGCGVGRGVGRGVGFGVGFGVGTGVGLGVGCGVGAGVGVALPGLADGWAAMTGSGPAVALTHATPQENPRIARPSSTCCGTRERDAVRRTISGPS